MRRQKREEWQSAMSEEISSFIKNQAWDLVPRPKDKSIVGCKWVYEIKEETTESKPMRYKARLAVKGYI